MSFAPRKVLVIAYYFPPLGLSGVQRTTKFVKYLPQYGWKPTVLTVAPTGYYALDASLLLEVEGTEIVRTSSLDANRLFRKHGVVKMPSERMRKFLQFAGDTFFIPDTKIGWKPGALKAANDLLKREQFDLIFATAPPQTDFLIGRELKKRTGLPLVLDYRDAWLDYPFKYFPTPLHKYLNYRLEKRVVAAADRIIVTHRRVKEGILKRYIRLHYNDVTIIPQGYDPEDFQTAEEKIKRRARFRITHAGTFYGGRNPSALLHGLRKLFDESPSLEDSIEVCFVGTIRQQDRQLAERLELEENVKFLGYLNHQECAKQLLASDLLYLVLDNDYQSPGKLYEYFGSQKPILASLVDGYMKEVVEASQASVSVPLDDAAAHAKALSDFYQQYERKKLKQVPKEYADRFNRVELTGELAKMFESLMDYERHAITKLQERVS
ncbi:MAG: glycosyltransferase family 4 protein [Ignavibacteriae bacterium]|nr:glycosyltransferase family 4 protein [Ignavibacteriota bacterium]